MRFKKWARILLAVAPVLSGCKGFWDVPSGSGGGTGSASGVFYVANQKTSEIAGFSFASGSTSLTAVSNSPYSLSVAPTAMAISPGGGYLYVSTSSGIYVYGIDSTSGALSILNSGGIISSDPATSMVIDPSGSWLIEAISGVNAVNAIPLDTSTGLQASGASEESTPLPAGAVVFQLATTLNGAANPYVFVAMGASGLGIIPFNSASTGNPFSTGKVVSPKNTGGGDITVAVDLSNPVVYEGETVAFTSGGNTGGVRMFTIGANEALTEVSGSPFNSGGIGPSSILATTNYVYVANKAVSGSSDGNITAFAINSTGGTVSGLTAVTNGSIAAGVSTVGLAEDSSGTYILAVNSSGTPDLNAYTIGTTGALTSYATGSTGSDPTQTIAIVAVP